MIAPRARRRPPTAGQSNLAAEFQGLRADYNAAKASRFRKRRTGVPAAGSGADYHYRTEADYLHLLEDARDMDRNDPVVGQIVDRAVDNTLQDGLQLDPQTGDPKLDADLWARWDAWANDPESCDIAGELTFADFERLAFRQRMVDGDTFFLPLESGHLQNIEGHRVRSPGGRLAAGLRSNLVHGILLDEAQPRRRLEYWITREDIDPSRPVSAGKMERYPARDEDGQKQVYHVHDPKRSSQTRGVTAFAPVFDLIGMHDDLQFANLVRAQVVSCFAIFRERELAFEGDDPAQRGELSTEQLADGSTRTVEGIAPGMEIYGQPGEKLTGFAPGVPNPEFFPHCKLVLQLIGLNLGLPLVLVLLDASETNFSGWRGAVDQARLGFRRNQQVQKRRFNTPIYTWKVRQWLAEDPKLARAAGRSRINIFGHRWNAPAWRYIEPMKDAAADLLRVRNGLTSPRRLHAERGADHQEIVAETIEDNAYAIREAKRVAAEINADFPGDAVHWREVLALPTPDGLTVQLAAREQTNREANA